ncbi:hypothetical protein [Pseudobacteroides cellulosolvens]|nr:hypothetical protein [Pseudobacteroides cellulosolvens]
MLTKSDGFISISDSIPDFIFGDISGDGHFDAGDYYLLKSYLL